MPKFRFTMPASSPDGLISKAAVIRPRAADDFATIRARIDELRRERDGGPSVAAQPSAAAKQDGSASERRRRARIEGLPPHWVPTVFVREPPS